MHPLRILRLPGWQTSRQGHWQTRWEQRQGFERVRKDDGWCAAPAPAAR